MQSVTSTDWILLSIGIGQILVLGGTGVFIGLQVLYAKRAQETLVLLERARRSSEYISRWNSVEMDAIRHKAVEAIRSQEIGKEHHVILAYLNFFFDLALALDMGLADDTLCMTFFRKPLHKYWTDVEPYLLGENNSSYDRVKRLDSRWQLASLPSSLAE
jgi:hypothetical protein